MANLLEEPAERGEGVRPAIITIVAAQNAGVPAILRRQRRMHQPPCFMDRSDSRPQLRRSLRQALAHAPRWKPLQRTRSGLSCSDACCSYVKRPSTPAERHCLAYRRCTCCLRCWEPARPPRASAYRGSIPHPVQPLSTLQTPRYRDAHKTRSQPARYGFDWMRLSLIGIHQLARTYSTGVV
jgi:hypothetical protein